MNKSYHNTVPVSGSELAHNTRRAVTQDEMVLQFFMVNLGLAFSPCHVWQTLTKGNKPITSIRRSMTNLTNAGLLVKTGNRIKGIYGDKVNTWTLKTKEPMQRDLF